ncbi:MAG TPA: hypothetical protein VLJ21_01390 [Candidatus Binatia bacterium]|nr:hypothetical protein [Candidatus Binatia bacterium]
MKKGNKRGRTTKLPGKKSKGAHTTKSAQKLHGIHAHREKNAPRCPSCNYCHILLSTSPSCPMCKMCGGCSKKLMHCSCREGE